MHYDNDTLQQNASTVLAVFSFLIVHLVQLLLMVFSLIAYLSKKCACSMRCDGNVTVLKLESAAVIAGTD
jgi:hypothetical protein